VVGADGLWSRVRFLIDATAQTSFSGKTAWRTLIDISAVPEYFRQPAVGLWMARSAHLVHYPVRGGKSLNVVAVINDREVEQGWNTPGSPDEITRHFRNWPADIQSLVSCAEGWRKWSLVTLPPLDRWTRGHITLLGDAAHPVLPFLAQGGALAVEDADALASALGGKASTLDDALQSYEDARKRRAVAIQGASQRLGHIYHSGGLEAFARNLMLRALRPEDLLKRYDWLYGFGAAD
jgi:salicylate hydroxylase